MEDASGRRIAATFRAHAAELGASGAVAQSDCTLTFALRTDVPYSFWLPEATYVGRASLDSGVTARQRESWSAHGMPAFSRSLATLLGPFHGTYTAEPEVRTVDAAWSPCRQQVVLTVATALQVRSEERLAKGSLRLQELSIPVHARRCP